MNDYQAKRFAALDHQWTKRIAAHRKMRDKARRERSPVIITANSVAMSAITLCRRELRRALA